MSTKPEQLIVRTHAQGCAVGRRVSRHTNHIFFEVFGIYLGKVLLDLKRLFSRRHY